jgi:hypothetical protein
MEPDLDSTPHCERGDNPDNCGIEITPEMLEAGADVLLFELGGRDCFVFVSPAELAERVYRAMRDS